MFHICANCINKLNHFARLIILWLVFLIDIVCETVASVNLRYLDFITATTCYGSDPTQFPSSNLFGAAGDGIWDNGASCGRQYLVRCISANANDTCIPEQTIQIRIVDYALLLPSAPSAAGATIILSDTAFGVIADSTAPSINIEFQR
ncbi:hypothetical protein LguiA_019883 [Lonicera macranthoides]